MKKVNPFCAILVCSMFCLLCHGQGTNSEPDATSAVALLRKAPYIKGDLYYCGDMVGAINALRHLGKDRALAVLHDYLNQNDKYAQPLEHEKMFLICRLLFVNPHGWKRPRLGEAAPSLDEEIAKEFPLFPLVVSNGVPFLLIKGFRAGGFTSDTGDKCVELCRSLPMVEADLSEKDYEKAAQDVVNSEMFRKLYPDPERRKEAKEMILAQVRPAADKEPKLSGSIKIEIKTSQHP